MYRSKAWKQLPACWKKEGNYKDYPCEWNYCKFGEIHGYVKKIRRGHYEVRQWRIDDPEGLAHKTIATTKTKKAAKIVAELLL